MVALRNRLLRSIGRPNDPENVTGQARAAVGNFFLQIHSVKVNRNSLTWKSPYGLGLIALYLFVIHFVSGLALMFYYVPSVERAYLSMIDLQSEVTFGAFITNLHRWSMHGMIIFLVLHMLRVFYTGGYKPPRQLSWIIGVLLLIVTGLMAFTGYLLPWDQQALWSVQVSSEVIRSGPIFGEHVQRILFGGPDIGQATLTRFYALHMTLLPLLTLLLTGAYLWSVRQHGGLAASANAKLNGEQTAAGIAQGRQGLPRQDAFPRNGDKTYALMGLVRGSSAAAGSGPRGTVMAWPTVFLLELAVFAGVVLVMAAISAFVHTSLGPQADPAIPRNPALMPWFLASIQELTLHMHPVFGGITIPTLFVTGLLAIPFIDWNRAGAGQWFGGRKGAKAAFGSAIAAGVIWIVLEWLDLGRDLAFRLNEALDLTRLTGGETPKSWPESFGFLGLYDLTEWSSFLWAGLIPFLVLITLLLVIGAAAKFLFGCNRREVIISVFTTTVASVMILTFVGSAMRGTDADLYAPWDLPNVIEVDR